MLKIVSRYLGLWMLKIFNMLNIQNNLNVDNCRHILWNRATARDQTAPRLPATWQGENLWDKYLYGHQMRQIFIWSHATWQGELKIRQTSGDWHFCNKLFLVKEVKSNGGCVILKVTNIVCYAVAYGHNNGIIMIKWSIGHKHFIPRCPGSNTVAPVPWGNCCPNIG